MKRDMELVREILLFLEDESREYYDDKETGAYKLIPIDGYTREEVEYHLMIMLDGGLITGELPRADDEYTTHRFVRLDWNSHDFIQTFRDDTVWNKAKSHLKDKGFQIANVPMDVLIELGKSYIKGLF